MDRSGWTHKSLGSWNGKCIKKRTSLINLDSFLVGRFTFIPSPSAYQLRNNTNVHRLPHHDRLPHRRSTYFPETMDSIVNGIISQSNTYVINFYPTSNFIYTLANSFDPNNEQHTLDLRQGKSLIIVERWQGGPALHRSRGVPSLKWKGAVTCARIRAPERMQYFGEAIFSDDYPGG